MKGKLQGGKNSHFSTLET